MTVINPNDATVVQTHDQPMTDIEAVKEHATAVRTLVAWNRVGVLMDEGPTATLVVLLDGDNVVSVLRFCLSVEESVDALLTYDEGSVTPMELRCWQGRDVTPEQAVSLSDLTTAWLESRGQSHQMSEADWRTFFDDLARDTLKRGRGTDVRVRTRNRVLFDAHGRCMFEGCGADLTVDANTGVRGNFGTLAHNVASSQSGPRGVLYLSARLADDPENILLLCDVHHRMVDTVARADYPAEELSAMRRRFCDTATELLDALALAPTPAFCVAWPVHQQRIAPPSVQQITQALKPIGARPEGRLRTVNDNEAMLRALEGELLWQAMSTAVTQAAAAIEMQAHTEGYRAALFAMGLMPALIGLGAKLGNKCEITPMLRYRENNRWYWPAKEPRGEFFTIEGLDGLSAHEGEACLLLGFTAVPKVMRSTAESLRIGMVSVVACDEYSGNGALGHPGDGAMFRQRMQELFHRLRDDHGVRRVHVLPCASNAACVFFGQSFDSHHPELVIYDFESQSDSMVPRLLIVNEKNQCEVKSVGARASVA